MLYVMEFSLWMHSLLTLVSCGFCFGRIVTNHFVLSLEIIEVNISQKRICAFVLFALYDTI